MFNNYEFTVLMTDTENFKLFENFLKRLQYSSKHIPL